MENSNTLRDDSGENYFKDFGATENINQFIIHLYHNNLLNKEDNNVLYITKTMFQLKLKELWNSKIDFKFENILKECKLITKTLDDNEFLMINMKNLFEYENFFLREMDKKQIDQTFSKHIVNLNNDKLKIIFNNKEEKLEFKTCVLTKVNTAFESLDNICNICLLQFSSNESFEEHLETHTCTSNFEWIEKTSGSPFPRFQIFYQISTDSQFYKFTLKTEYSGITVNSIVTVRSKDIPVLVYHKNEIEIDEGGSFEFAIDKHLFIKSMEQPIYVIFHMFVNAEQNQRERFIELHLIQPILLLPQKEIVGQIKKSELKAKKGIISEHFPRASLKELYSRESFNENDLFNIDDSFKKFCEEDGKNLTTSNISNILTFLQEMEDIETEKFYGSFTQRKVSINRFRRSGRDFEYFFKLHNLPDDIIFQNTINCGDEVFLMCNDNPAPINENLDITNKKLKQFKRVKTKFFGIISNIYGTTIYFECRNNDRIDISKRYDVQFRPNRRNFVYQYSALNSIDQYSLISLFLFPDDKPFKDPAYLELNIFDENVRNNPEQREAIMNIVDGIKDFLPYIIVGPPGTGKTTTIVECILQLQIKTPEKKILVTAGSNAACNEIAKRLAKVINSNFQNVKMLRLFSKSVEKSYEHIDKILIEASNLSYGYHFYPSLASIKEYDIVICTTSLIGRLKSAGLQPSTYSYCFIDECAASTEPEALVAIEAVFHSDINVIITGDPKQLGPILQSNRAAEYGLKYSILERLLNRECYRINDDKKYNRRIQTRLVRNFRTHPDILTISNKLFYANDLMACASKDLTHWATGWCKLPQKDTPLIFHYVNGYTRKDKYSTSLFNPKEVNVVMDYVKRLMYFNINNKKIKEEDIGVISPYKKQNTIIREELDKRNWYKIATGSVETFQGQEKPIIIISTVRSVLSDRSGVGFLTNEKRLNVMLTRAQALLILIGNTEFLSSVPNWKESILYCKEKNVLIENKSGNDEDINFVDLTNSFKNITFDT